MKPFEVEEAGALCDKIIDGVREVFVGNRVLLRMLLAACMANGHVLFEDYPGLGKTLLVKVFARVLGCDTKRIQFTPDLLPADIIGTNVWRQEHGTFELFRGPIFTQMLLADEINRAPPKTQAALLEAMEERQVTIEGNTMPLEAPFFVVATQNPIEQEGTYPLPEAQLDRFYVKLRTGYPATDEIESSILERRIMWQQDDPTSAVQPVTDAETFRRLQQTVETQIYVDPAILNYITKIVRATRSHPRVAVGASPRGGLALLKIARSMALIHGRDFVVPDDVKIVVEETLAHRIILTIEDTLDGFRPEKVVEEVVRSIPVPTDLVKRPG
jgi:MoxR-like ATPase